MHDEYSLKEKWNVINWVRQKLHKPKNITDSLKVIIKFFAEQGMPLALSSATKMLVYYLG